MGLGSGVPIPSVREEHQGEGCSEWDEERARGDCQATPDVRLPRTCHFWACRARRGNSQCLPKSRPYAGPSAGTEVARLVPSISGTASALHGTQVQAGPLATKDRSLPKFEIEMSSSLSGGVFALARSSIRSLCHTYVYTYIYIYIYIGSLLRPQAIASAYPDAALRKTR